jgi:phage baseplate assembly protein W
LVSFKSSGIKSDSNILKRKITKKPAGIVTPLTINEGNDGIIKTRFSATDQIKDNFRNMILTNKGERLGRYDYGCNLRKMVTELNIFEDFEQAIMKSISDSTKRYMPMIDLESFNSEYSDDNELELKNITITIIYNIPILGLTNEKLDVTLYVV